MQQDVAKRSLVIRQAQASMADQVHYVPIFQVPQFVAAGDKVSGIVLDQARIFRLRLVQRKS